MIIVFLLATAVYGLLIFSYCRCDRRATILFITGLALNIFYTILYFFTAQMILVYVLLVTALFMIVTYHKIKVRK